MNSRRSLLLALTLSLPLAAQKSKLLDKDTFMDMESITAPHISPDGSQIVFSRGYVDKMKDQDRAGLWITDTAGTRLREISSGPWRDSTPVFSPDGKRIAFLSDRDGTTQLHIMWLDTRETLQLTHVTERTPTSFKWSPDGRWIAYSAFIQDEEPILAVKLPKAPKGAQWAKPAVIVDRLSWGSDGVGPTNKGYNHVFLIDAIQGGTPRQLTSGNFNHNTPEWSADGKTIYVSSIRKADAEYLKGDSEIYSIDVATGSAKQLTDRKGPDSAPTASPNGRYLAYIGYDDQSFTNHVASLYLMDTAGGGKRTWITRLPSSPNGLLWAEDSSGIYYSMEESGTTNLYFSPIDAPVRKVTQGVHVLTAVTVSRNGKAAAIRSNYKEPGTLVTFDINKPAPRKLLDVNEDVLTGVTLAEQEELTVTSSDGLKVQGWLMKPANFDPRKKYPMLLFIHGGPWSMYNVAFNWSFQNFAANGVAVLYMNPRGSTGYGQDFVNGIQYSYPGKDYDDLMAGVDAAIAKGWVDEKNLFVCGGSGGGVLTAWIVGHTNRFRAAVSMRPVIDWHSFVGNTDGPNWYNQFKKFPWEDPMEYAVRSPLHYVANVTTPTMVMTGESDLRTPITQSEEFYRALKMLKKETLLVRMPEEFHGWRRPSHKLLQQLYLQAWFDKYRTKDTSASAGGN